MRVGAKTSPSHHTVVVQHPQGAKVHALRILPLGKAEAVRGAQPAMVGMAAGAVGVNNGLHGEDSKSVVQKTRG